MISYLLAPALAVSLGWMLRGYIGGGPLGAMIPGAMLGLALCLLLGRRADAALVAAFAAVGVGLGGQETYGQTVGLSMHPETYRWAIAGFFLKGLHWGLAGGALIGIALDRDRYRFGDLAAAFALLLAGTYAGWKIVNEPKWIYFSNRLDKPREELWFGLILGAVVMLVYLSWRSGAALAWSFALWGALAGGVGFAAGAAAQVWGEQHMHGFAFGWWKFMEGTFGLLLGLGFGVCAWRNRGLIAPRPQPDLPAPLLRSAVFAALSIAIAIGGEGLPSRHSYTFAAVPLLIGAVRWRDFAWQTAITTTACAFAIDLIKHRHANGWGAWVFVAAVTVAVSAYVALRPDPRRLFVLMTVLATAFAMLKSFLPPATHAKPVAMEAVFVCLAVVVSAWAIRAP